MVVSRKPRCFNCDINNFEESPMLGLFLYILRPRIDRDIDKISNFTGSSKGDQWKRRNEGEEIGSSRSKRH